MRFPPDIDVEDSVAIDIGGRYAQAALSFSVARDRRTARWPSIRPARSRQPSAGPPGTGSASQPGFHDEDVGLAVAIEVAEGDIRRRAGPGQRAGAKVESGYIGERSGTRVSDQPHGSVDPRELPSSRLARAGCRAGPRPIDRRFGADSRSTRFLPVAWSITFGMVGSAMTPAGPAVNDTVWARGAGLAMAQTIATSVPSSGSCVQCLSCHPLVAPSQAPDSDGCVIRLPVRAHDHQGRVLETPGQEFQRLQRGSAKIVAHSGLPGPCETGSSGVVTNRSMPAFGDEARVRRLTASGRQLTLRAVDPSQSLPISKQKIMWRRGQTEAAVAADLGSLGSEGNTPPNQPQGCMC